MPTAAAPTAVPMIADSANGVYITRSAPNSSDEPVGHLEGAAEHADVLAHQAALARRRAARRAARSRSPAGRSSSASGVPLAKPLHGCTAVAERLGLAVAEDAVEYVLAGIGIGPRERLFARAASSSCAIGRRSSSTSTPSACSRVLLAVDRVALLPLLDLLLGGRTSCRRGRRVRASASSRASISVGPPPGNRAVAGGAGRFEHRLDIVAVDADALEPVGLPFAPGRPRTACRSGVE